MAKKIAQMKLRFGSEIGTSALAADDLVDRVTEKAPQTVSRFFIPFPLHNCRIGDS